MDTATMVAIVQGLMGLLMAIGGYMWRDLKAKADKTHEELLQFKVTVATSYIGNEELKSVVDNLTRGLDTVAASTLRIENRINAQLDRRTNDGQGHL